MGYEIDFLPVGDGSKSGDAIALRYGNLHSDDPNQQMVIVIDGGYTDDGEALVDLIKTHYGTDYVDVVVSTHPDQDHVTGLEVVLEQLRVGQLWMHQPWKHSQTLSAARSLRFQSSQMSEKTIKSLQEASDLELIAVRRGVPIIEPFTGTSTSDNCFFVVGPDRPYYDELITQLPSTTVQETALSRVLAKAAELAQKLVPETLYLETLTDAGETSAQNNTSVISVLSVDGRLSIFTGDAGIPALERAMDTLEDAGYMPGMAKFAQIPHHGSRRNVGPTILDRMLGAKGTTDIRGSAFVSAAKDGAPKHPAKKVTNAFRRRGYRPHATVGNAKRHHHEAPDRTGYSPCEPLPLYSMVEESDD
jgi:beta-lactamase superfamily II metal-dependent hydrolase